MDLKIVHLIRDPRGMWRSRKALYPDMEDGEMVKKVTETCENQMRSHAQFATDEKYLVVLYEDLNRLPFEKVEVRNRIVLTESVVNLIE